MGYIYKGPAKTVPRTAPSKKEKGAAIHRLVKEVKGRLKRKECEIS